ncbi:MAG: prepilin-type N-terminal cleavage/methylation domain-containing protein [Planctomycetaceae bacterium]
MKRRGFTLLEVLVALGVSLMLMTAVYSSIDMHWKYQSAGRLEMERGQVARAVLQRLALDIRSVQFVKPRASEEESDAETELGAETIEFVDPDDAVLMQSVGVVGTANRLMLHVSKPLPARALRSTFDDEMDETMLFHSDQMSVVWFLADPNGGELEAMVAARVEIDPPVGVISLLLERIDDGGPLGLARSEADRFQSTQAEADGDLSVMAERAEFLAPEIDLLLFRYFDGIEWMEEWDSEALGALPLAIEITIGFVPPPEDDVLRAAAAGSIPDSYRFVVALPLAESVDLESGL